MQIRERNSPDVINNRDEKPKNQMGCSRTKEKEGMFTVTDDEKKSGSQEILGNRERLGLSKVQRKSREGESSNKEADE